MGVFDKFKNIDVINEIRDRYDSLVNLVRPHITVGKLNKAQELNKAYEYVRSIDVSFQTTVKKISVEMIGEHEESIIVFEKMLE